jgi:hypothetical protein
MTAAGLNDGDGFGFQQRLSVIATALQFSASPASFPRTRTAIVRGHRSK